MSTIINGTSSAITFPDSTVQNTAVTAPSAVGQIPIGNSANGYTNATITAGTGITVTNASGAITIANSAPAVTSGEAKAWVSYKGTSTQSIYASYNVSSVTYNTTGYYTINYTNAFSDANYCVVATCSKEGSTLIAIANTNNSSARVAPTTTATALSLQQYNGTAGDTAYVYVAVFR